MSTTITRSVAAECRAVENGHRAFLQDDGSFRVVSDTQPDVAYRVTYWESGSAWSSPASAPTAPIARRWPAPSPGHQALCARRLEREGLARWNGTEWVLGPKAPRRTEPQPGRPRNGLPFGDVRRYSESCHACGDRIDGQERIRDRRRVESGGWVYHVACLVVADALVLAAGTR